MLVWYKVDVITISLKINWFSPWYSWKIAELALNNNYLLTQQNIYILCHIKTQITHPVTHNKTFKY